jgi:hypothetical protein
MMIDAGRNMPICHFSKSMSAVISLSPRRISMKNNWGQCKLKDNKWGQHERHNCPSLLCYNVGIMRPDFSPLPHTRRGTYFFTVNLLQRHPNDLLIRHIDVLRQAVKEARKRRPFHIVLGQFLLTTCLLFGYCLKTMVIIPIAESH